MDVPATTLDNESTTSDELTIEIRKVAKPKVSSYYNNVLHLVEDGYDLPKTKFSDASCHHRES